MNNLLHISQFILKCNINYINSVKALRMSSFVVVALTLLHRVLHIFTYTYTYTHMYKDRQEYVKFPFKVNRDIIQNYANEEEWRARRRSMLTIEKWRMFTFVFVISPHPHALLSLFVSLSFSIYYH